MGISRSGPPRWRSLGTLGTIVAETLLDLTEENAFFEFVWSIIVKRLHLDLTFKAKYESP